MIVAENNRLRAEIAHLHQLNPYLPPWNQSQVTNYGHPAFTIPAEPPSGLEPTEQAGNPQLTGQLPPSGSSSGQHYQPQSRPPLPQAQRIPYPPFGTRRGEPSNS